MSSVYEGVVSIGNPNGFGRYIEFIVVKDILPFTRTTPITVTGYFLADGKYPIFMSENLDKGTALWFSDRKPRFSGFYEKGTDFFKGLPE